MQQVTPPSMKVVALPAPRSLLSCQEEDHYNVKTGSGINSRERNVNFLLRHRDMIGSS
jgi:hypothetical protein